MASSDYAQYDAERVLASWQVDKLAAGQSITSVNSGNFTNTAGTGSITVVEGINGLASTTSSYCFDGYIVELTPPIDEAGNVPDCDWTFAVNGVKVETLRLNGSMYRNMMPLANQQEGDPSIRVTLGKSFQALMQQVQDSLAGRTSAKMANIPLYVTGLKLGPSTPITVTCTTIDGWGQTGTALRPAKCTIKGNEISVGDVPSLLATYAAVGGFRVVRPPFPGLMGNHSVTGTDASAFMGLPGGTKQTGTTIFRKIIEATNAKAITTTAQRYVMSNLQDVGGTPGSTYAANDPTDTVQSDLGDLNEPNAAFIWNEFGVDFSPTLLTSGSNPQVYVGLYLNSTLLIPGNNSGRLISMLTNPLQYGAVGYSGPNPTRFLRLPAMRRFVNALSWGQTVVPALSAQGLTQLGAGTMYVMKGGLQVQGQLTSF